MSKAMAHKLVNETEALNMGQKAGFKKLIFTDGFGHSWMYEIPDQK
jgi:hypothetical protein